MLLAINPIRDIPQIDATGGDDRQGKTDEFRSLLESSVQKCGELAPTGNHAVDSCSWPANRKSRTRSALATQKADWPC